MSDQGYSAAEDKDDKGGIFCQKCSPVTRKVGYYATFLVGAILFVLGIVNLIGFNIYFLVGGSLLLILCPLWVKTPCALINDLKNPIRITSCIIFLVSLGATIAFHLIFDNSIIDLICGICLALAGIWYFLSFFTNGQKACLNCIKSCCGKDEQKSESE